MDINEFHIMFKKESPIFNSKVLGEIVGKVLQDENVQNSGMPIKKSLRKEKNSMKRSDFIRSAESVLPTYSLVNDSTLQGCIRKPDSTIESNIKSVSIDASKSNVLPPQSCSGVSQQPQQSYTHAPMSQGGIPNIPIRHLPQFYDSQAQVMANHTASSDGYYENTVFPSPYMPYAYTDTNTYDRSTTTANECVLKNTYSISEKITEEIKGHTKRSPSKVTLPWQSITESSCQQLIALQNENSNTEFKGEAFVTDKPEYTMSSGRQVDGATVREPLDTHRQQSQEAVAVPLKKQSRIDDNKKTCCHEEEPPEVEDTKVLTPIAIGKVDEKEMLNIISTLVQAQTCFAQFPSAENRGDKYIQNEDTSLNHKTAASKTTDIEDQTKDEKHLRMKLVGIMVKYFEQKIVETVRFAKRIPGFLELSRDDQASLIKASRNESDLISGMKSVDFSDKVFTSLDGENFSVEQMQTLFPVESLNLFMEGSRKVERLKATVEEEAVLRAITLTFSDRCELQCREKVEDIQNRLVSCLLYVVKKQPVPLAIRMGKMFDFLLFCRRYSDVELKTMKNLMLETDQYASNRIVTEIL